MHKYFILFCIVWVLPILYSIPIIAQNDGTPNPNPDVPERKEIRNVTETWIGLYTKYRIKERLFYYGEYHLRRRDQFWNEMGQIYLRFGLSYLVNKNFEFTAGIVNPYYWAPGGDSEGIDKVVSQFRGWQQFLFIIPFDRLKIYHQIRTEQRWKRDYTEGSEFKLDFRFRYKLLAYYPLNKPTLDQGALFLSTYNEIFIQAGKGVIYNHFEDFRFFAGLGYILNDQVQFQTGYQWTYRHDDSPFLYQSRHIVRFSIYHNLDFFGRKQKENRSIPVGQ
ncbi:DUF2490 domain-containing protein [Marivirga sp. S37H4]|uniref:DUF2490 domain-containing protein n=1 Tax=Marivirga aurantiaca TaxID=2802615 RepID=A0A934WVY1_9BACT|nr:DUF2490 domain-containing protein [Marivirga aurantiaca]MBK6264044.1 DUF2490 domain-containing protein [Marivirga aurantiaca]